MLSGVLHDFKTPMTIVSGYAQLMSTEDDPVERREYYESILKQFEQLNHMTREILSFARGERNLLLRKVFLHKFVAEVVESLRAEFAGRNIEMVIEERFRGEARFDDMKMKRVVFNLARNAREAMPDGGRFVFGVEKEGDQVVFRVTDTGQGIPKEVEDRLFETFVTSGKESGTGLGLAIVKKIVDEHGGTISHESRPGYGTSFTVHIPLGTGAAIMVVESPPEQKASV
jgi:signal transduction histidine kinase